MNSHFWTRGEPESAMAADGTATMASAISLDAAERRLLAVMPLHAITSVHGEAGLRERLLMEIARFPAAGQARVGAALALASRLHAGDRRQREPYASHLLRVAVRILSPYHIADPDVACAALLHDAVEDHAEDIAPGGSREAAFAVLAGRFGERTAGLVAAVTNPVWEAGRDEHEQYRQHVAESLDACPWARVIKVSDVTDNAVGLFHDRAEGGQAGRQVPAAAAGAAEARPSRGHAARRKTQGSLNRGVPMVSSYLL